jgi:serine/threonine protein kinase/tetratricopeptide (TPR) repeat protein
MIGAMVSHYKILEHLGGGGMGVVYKARDLNLDRLVALKFLPPELTRDPEARERFVHEAKAASALDHQNICVVHDIGETEDHPGSAGAPVGGQSFIVMALYEGETLKKKIEGGSMKVDEAIDLAHQIARGLAEAHEHGIVHRDMKPANVMVTREGVAKIVDFGLAKLAGRTMLTKAGSTLGTVAYMSPEQARGEPADHRTDIWSLGVMLYEMLTGKRPFEADYDQATIFKILNDSPDAIAREDLPKALEKILAKAMAKDPSARYGRAEEMANELRAVQQAFVRPVQVPAKPVWRRVLIPGFAVLVLLLAAGLWFLLKPQSEPGLRKSIAVLPITSITKSQSDQEFVDGLHDHLLTQLAGIRDLTLISRQSVLQYRDTQKRSKEIAKELDVQMLMEASVQHAAGQLRMQVQLIDGPSEAHLWAKTYDRQLTDIFAVQTDLAESITRELAATITPAEKSALERPWTTNSEALELYMRGLNLWAVSFTAEGNIRAAECLDEAGRLDPQFAAAFAMASHVHTNVYAQGRWDSSPSRLAKAEAALRRAQALDPALPETHIAAGSFARLVKRDLREAERELKAALAARPNSYEATHELAFVKVQFRELDEAQLLFERGEVLDPLSRSGGMDSRTVAWGLRHYDEALRLSERYLSRFPDDPMAYVYHALLQVDGFGDLAGAEETIERMRTWDRTRRWMDTRDSESLPPLLNAIESYVPYLRREYARASGSALLAPQHFGARKMALHLLWACRNERGVQAYLDSLIVRNTQAVARNGANGNAWLRIALAQAIQGEKSKAREAARSAESFQPSFDDPWMYAESYPEWLASVCVILGDHSKAIGILKGLLSRPGWMTVWKLRLDPVYDPLRNDPAFKALLRDEVRASAP